MQQLRTLCILFVLLTPISVFSPQGSTVCLSTAQGTYYDSTTGLITPCRAGQYDNSTACVDCPAGFACTGFNAAPSACANNTYQDQTGQSSCRACPGGKMCLDVAATPVNCSAGQFSPEGDSTCRACATGYYSEEGFSQCYPCPAGYSCEGATRSECDPGTYSTQGIGSCTSCNSDRGEHTDGAFGATACLVCPAGFQCLDIAVAPVECGDGQYSPVDEKTCLDCPAGHYCNQPQDSPIACPLGTYSTRRAGTSGCTQCPAGSSCLDPRVSPIACDDGRYSTLGEATCKPCPAGNQCPDTSSDPTPCDAGYFSWTGNGTCFPCPAGFFCVDPSLSPVKCSEGTTTNGSTAQTRCDPCPAGYSCSDSSSVLVECGNGEYIPGDTCIPCPAGASCTETTALACEPGTWSLVNELDCTECEAGTYCPYTNQAGGFACEPGSYSGQKAAFCTPCPEAQECPNVDGSGNRECDTGYYSIGGLDSCIQCQAGQACPNKDGSGNFYCVPGTYSLAGATRCESCPAGSACPNTDSNTIIACDPGFYSGPDQTTCTRCPAGYACTSTDAAVDPTPCQGGTYSGGGMDSCQDCPAGNACPTIFADIVIICPDGTYSEANSMSCLSCPAGSECQEANQLPQACDDGYFSTGGQKTCTLCPAGYQCTNKDRNPEKCPAGQYSSEGSQTGCQDCDPGYLCPEGSDSQAPENARCPIGSYCESGATTATPCDAGTYGPTDGLGSSGECIACPPGYFCPAGTAGVADITTQSGTPSVENLCPRGHFCPEGTPSDTEYPCPAGKYNQFLGQSDEATACRDCPIGRYCLQGSTNTGIACSRGYYCNQGGGTAFSTRTACPAGTYTSETGARSMDDCVDCPPGYYCPEGTSDPVPCSNGTYQPLPRQGLQGSCLRCTAGMVCSTTGLTGPDGPCAPGHYCPQGTSLSTENPCPAGFYTDAYNLTNSDQCDICPERFACPSGTGGVDVPPLNCAPGYYCKNQTEFPTQRGCPAGSYSNKTNLANFNECWECPRGSYCVENSTSPQGPCPAGHYCPAGTKYDTEFPCDAGTFSNKTGNIRMEDCGECLTGSYCTAGASSPTPCSPGTYNPGTGSSGVADCLACEAGYYCPDNGTTDPIPCGIGYYSGRGLAECELCLAGYYCDENTTSDILLQNKTCPHGMHCPSGTSDAPNLQENACPAGFYCRYGNLDAYPVPCPITTFSGKTGLKTVDECEDCRAGFYCDVTNLTAPAGACPGGYYCPPKTGAADSFPCPAGTFLNGTAAVSSDSCTTCTSGYFCPNNGTAIPELCWAGYYCIPGSKAPRICGEGTYGNRTGATSTLECMACPGGYYCEGTGDTSQPTGPCEAGYYCTGGAFRPDPVDGITGDVCPRGGYCPENSTTPNACRPGFYSNFTKAVSEDNCTACDPGKFCSGISAEGVTGDCSPGFYCTGGASTSTQFPAQPGYFAEAGAANQRPCLPGTYAPGNISSSCETCPAGQYCDEEAMARTKECFQGAWCPRGSIEPKLCPPGTFNDEFGQFEEIACNPCPAGMFCSQSGLPRGEGSCDPGYWCGLGSITASPNGSLSNGGPCPIGHYCPAETKSSTQFPCPEGRYNNQTHAQNETYCKRCDPGKACTTTGLIEPDGECAAGFYCTGGATMIQPEPGVSPWGDECSSGHYCPTGSGYEIPCEPGTYNNLTQQPSCNECPEGYQCKGNDSIIPCPEGRYCPAGTNDTAPKCPPGTYRNVEGGIDSSDCFYCDAGFYCNEYGAVASVNQCDPGYFCRLGVNVSNPSTDFYSGDGGRCPPGFYCPQGTGEPDPCGPGKYSNKVGATEEGDCVDCDKGMYCLSWNLTMPEEECEAGYYCSGGSNTSTPVDGNGGYLCPAGFYCEAGTPEPMRCPPGGYSNREGLGVCDLCEEGYYCPGNTTDYTLYPCVEGYFCPKGTAQYTDYPCPPGTYGNASMLSSADQCFPCDPGKYCIGDGRTTWTGECDPGFYCLTNSTTNRPSGIENYTDPDSCICPASDVGGVCPVGFFCPRGTGRPNPCTGGYYCDTEGRSNVTGPCSAGFYCSSMATKPQPDNDATGGECPAGFWCDSATADPEPCPSGRFGPGTGLESEDDCSFCTEGFYCPNLAQTNATLPCDAGYYCPPGQNTSNRFPCEPGYMCPPQSPDQVLCESGYYQDEPAQDSCKICEAGYYCDRSLGPISDYTNFECPVGSYCLRGTKFANETNCPEGTYGDRTMLTSAEQCNKCKTGRFCPIEGLTESDIDSNPDYQCAAGYFCIESANISTPEDGVTGRPCDKGRYCPEGTTEEILCDIGKFNNETGQGTPDACIPCTGGFYCSEMGLDEPSGSCDPRYYCPGGDTEIAPMDQNCTVGHFCPGQTANPIPCPDGTFTKDRASAVCQNCSDGFYCVDGINEIVCPRGFYCPSGTGSNWEPCKIGTYGQATGLASEFDCMPCDPGQYCDTPGANTTSGPCEARHFCRNGSSTDRPVGTDGVNDLCSPGHFCPAGTPIEENCPAGTYNDDYGLATEDECYGCPPGMYCEPGSSSPTGNCSGGYFCTGNATSPTPPEGETGGPCPQGFFCPPMTSDPKSCPPGRYNNQKQMEECFECMAGYYCPENASDYISNECPAGYYCPNGTSGPNDYPCPAGTWSNETKLQDLRGCKPCPEGYYCENAASTLPTDQCQEGWYCTGCAWSSTPGIATDLPYQETSCLCPVDEFLNSTGGRCKAGTFCPQGSSAPRPCTRGHFCEKDELGNTTGLCEAGFYCIEGASNPRPLDGVTGDECPVGHYCEAGEDKVECPPGTFSEHRQNKRLQDCTQCTAGYYCAGGESTESGVCQAEYYCPEGQNVSAPAEYQCPSGYRCPPAQGAPIPCGNGTYQSEAGKDYCDECPEGYYCQAIQDNGSIIGVSVPVQCDIGFYCPNGTQYRTQYGCPKGTYGTKLMAKDPEDCKNCDGGEFCDETGLQAPSGSCLEGFYCTERAEMNAPTDNITGNVCYLGHYCTNGTQIPEPCPEGFYGPSLGLRSEDECEECDSGMFCPYPGRSSPEGNCTEGYYCPLGSTNDTAFPCPAGYKCPEGVGEPIPCEPGTYTNVTLQATCAPCEEGSYCNGTGIMDCPLGYYCPMGTGGTLEPCPRGTYGDTVGLQREDQCKWCDPGFYCPDLHATSYEDPCDPGFFCRNGSDSQRPSGGHRGDAGVCPRGYYCEIQTGEPRACEAGTFNSFPQATGPEFCENCTAGKYCNDSGLAEPTGDCFPGFYCSGGSSEGSFSSETATGGPCPPGFYCPEGSSIPFQCVNGSYTNSSGMESCTPCEAGFYCPDGAETPYECPAGHYCEYRSISPTPCSNGTFNPETGSTTRDACQLCLPGEYCPNEGMNQTAGKCAPGWYCTSGSWMDKPVAVGGGPPGGCECPPEGGIGGQCQAGEYCPEGAYEPKPCDPGFYCFGPELHDVSGPCKEGHFCSGGSTYENPINEVFGDECPPGTYCPLNSSSATDCPSGYFSGQSGNTAESDCELCEGGWYCPSPGLNSSFAICEVGFFCPNGSTEKAPPENECPRGTACPAGSPIYNPCYSGTYQPETRKGICRLCEAGKYCNYDEAVASGEKGVVTPETCPPGFFCPPGANSSTENPCPPGKYGNQPGMGSVDDCDDCDGGMYCDQYNQSSPTAPCYAGYYCPIGSSSPEQETCPTGSYCEANSDRPFPCPIGTYGPEERLRSQEECSPCDPGSYCDREGLNSTAGVCSPGFYCSGNSTRPDPDGEEFGDRCPPGAYCSANSSQPLLCPRGTFNPDYEKSQEEDCIPCTPGYYCNGTGLSSESNPCDPGFYCNGSATVATEEECSLGHECPGQTPEPIPCTSGTYANTTQTHQCATCPAGSYCIDGAIDPLPCPRGQYCPEGTGLENNLCGPGTYNDRLGITSMGECTECKNGFYCGTPGMDSCCTENERCTPGYNCETGVNVNAPNNQTNTGIGGPCQPGFQCPNGYAEPCPPGTFARTENLRECEPCESGSYCDGGTIEPSPCLKGYYCPIGTNSSSQYPCPPGTYNNKTGQSDAGSCDPCLGGMFCDGEANDVPDDFCSEGHFCISGSDSPNPEVTGTTVGGGGGTCSSVSDCACPELNDTMYGLCPPGYYCPLGTDRPRPCERGRHCPEFGMAVSGDNCTVGFYCPYGSSLPTQEDCQPGYYCLAGTEEPAPCPAGTYSGESNNEDVSSCFSCPAGQYCGSNPSIAPTANCTPGFYCPGGDAAPTLVCSRHHFCPEGAKNETVCKPGTYQDFAGRPDCDACLEGMICDPYDGNLEPENCPIGFFCVSGTPVPEPCLPGTVGERDQLRSPNECSNCPSGQYCNGTGDPFPSGNCDPGYYCSGRASRPDAFNDSAAQLGEEFVGNGICPIGHYCNGVDAPMPCPAGTFSMELGVEDENGCLPCPAGKYCEGTGRADGNSAPDCEAGFVCIGRATTSQPIDGITGYPCPRGFYCPAGTPIPLSCPPGSYSEVEGSEFCTICREGTYCPSYNTTTPEECSPGFFCERNSTSQTPCEEGTYNRQTGSTSITACTPCNAGMFCNGTGNAEPDGFCAAGYHCNGGSITPTPNGASATENPFNGPCPAGRFCTEGTTAPELCPPGTLRNETGAGAESDCLNCTAGYFCASFGRTDPSGPCSCGYYCPGTAPNSDPNQVECPVGFQCPTASIRPVPCSVGSYQPNPANCNCDLCPAGFFCNDTLSGGQTPCPPYSYCPEGASYPLACPNGTYTLDTDVGLRDETACRECPPGRYCTGGRIQGNCSAGYLCKNRAYSATSNGSVENCDEFETCAGPCPAGFYCEEGVTDKVPCPENTLRAIPGASQLSDCEYCPAGFWCREGDPIPDPCPVGFYCQGLNTNDCTQGAGPQPCAEYTYNNETGIINANDCKDCPPGFWCNDTGLSDFSLYACELGYYCVGGGNPPAKCPGGTLRDTTGATSVDDCANCTGGYYCPHPNVTNEPNINGIPCERGFECPEGTVEPKPCTAGYYCEELTAVPEICPAGYFCPKGSYTFEICVYPYYCPEGTGTPRSCDIGYQPLNISDLRSDLEVACQICPVGFYRNSSEDDACQPCPPGYYCPEGTGNYQKNPCPAGHYCPEGGLTPQGGRTGTPIPCPAGYFGQQAGSEFSVCQPCAAGMYNNREGQTACFPCGSSAESVLGSTQCTCSGFNRAFQPSDGACVCLSGYIYYDEVDQLQSEGNAPTSCEAMVDVRCAGDEARIASNRACAIPAAYSCVTTCGDRGGTLNVDLGMCLCNSVTVPEEIPCYDCNTMGATYDSTTGALTITTTSTSNSSSTTSVDVPNVFGPADKVAGPANILLVQMSPQGIFAAPPTSSETASSVVNGNLQQDIADSLPSITSRVRRSIDDEYAIEDEWTINRYIGRRILQADNTTATSSPTTTTSLPIISNPVICLQLGEMLIFNVYVNQDDRTLSNYPVYVRNHLYNTNPNFDYGALRQLETYITQSNWNVSNFAHVFLQAGIFVFRDSQVAGQELIVNVLQNGLICDSSRMQPTTISSLTTLGIGKQNVSNLTPDWVLIVVLLALFFACVVVLVIAVIVWRPQDAGIFPMKYWMPRYRSLGEPYLPPHKAAGGMQPSHDSREGLGLVRERGEAEGAEANVLKDEQLLEEFNVRTLYDKLEDQNLHLSSQLDKHQNSLQGFYEKINNQAEGLKSMLNKLDTSQLQAAELLRSQAPDAGATVVNTSLHRDLKLADSKVLDGLGLELFNGGQSLREKELLQSLEALINKLNTGKITVSDEVLNDARNRLKGIDDKETAKLDKSAAKKNSRNDDDWKIQGQESLIREQERDMINLDRELISGEREAISNLLISQDEQRKKLISDMNDKLAFKMQGDLSDKEMELLLSGHAKELENALGALSKERERQMRELKEQLAARRKERAKQLEQMHKEQCEDVGMPVPPSDDGKKDEDNLDLMEKQLEAALLKESAAASKEEQDLIAGSGKEDGAKLSKSFDDELDTMVANGLITDEVREKLRQQIIDQENELDNRMKNKREMQMRAMRERMAERKKRRMKKLKQQQKEEKAFAVKEGKYTDEMKERHQVERDALEAEIDAEAAAMEKDMNEALETEHLESLKDIHKEVIQEMNNKHGVDPVAQQELLDRYRRELDNYDHVTNMRKATQAQDLKAQLAARRARRAAEVQKSAEKRRKQKAKEDEERRLEELARIREEEEAAREAEQDGLDIPTVIVTDNLEVQALAKEQERILVETEQQQAAEADKLMHDLDRKEKEDLEALERKLKEEKDKIFSEASAKHEAEARARTDLSEEQIQQLLAAHQQELDELSQSLEKQQGRQRLALQEKLAARRKRKTAALRTRQDMEKQREELEQRKEMAQVQAKTAKEAERKAIIEGIERNGAAASERIIQKVLEKRHAQELKDLEEEFALKKKMLIEEALKLIREQYQAERDALLSKHEAELLQLENERLPTDEFERRKEELLEKQQQELKLLDNDHESKCKEIEEAVAAEWKLDYSQAKLKLKEKHYQEFAEALRELAPTASQQQTAEQAEESAKKLEETKQRLEQEREEAEKQLADERRLFEEDESRRMAMAMDEFEKELEFETEQDKLKAEKTLNNLVQRKEKLLQEKKNKMREEMERAAAAGASEEEQKKILDQHEKDVENLTNKMDRERLRMKTQLEERLKKRRNEKLEAKKNNLRKESELNQKDIESKQKAELQKIQEKQVETLQKTAERMEKEDRDKAKRALEQAVQAKTLPEKEVETLQTAPDVLPTPAPVSDDLPFTQLDGGLPMMPFIAPAPTINEKDLHEMLNHSPLYHTLQEIQGALQDEKKTSRLSDSASSGFVGPDADSRDSELVPTPLSDLTTRELVAYKFGTFILTLLRTRRTSHPAINLLVAEKVPAQPELKQNAFRGSFCFDEGNAILYIKRTRLTQDSIGRLSLLLVHVMAHLASGDFENDNSTAFLQEFYQCLAVLSDDLFFARYRAEPGDFEKDGASKASISQDLLDVKLPSRDIATPASESLSRMGIQERIEKYAHSSVTSLVRDELGSLESKINQAKSGGTFSGVEAKLLSLSPSTPSTSQSARRPGTTDSSSAQDESDQLNSEFMSLTREADHLHNLLNSGDDKDKVTVRNRLNNVQIKLSDVQKRLRFLH